MIAGFADDHWNMRGEGTFCGIRDQDREGVRAHERQRGGAIFDPEMFGDVHSYLRFRILVLNAEEAEFPEDFLITLFLCDEHVSMAAPAMPILSCAHTPASKPADPWFPALFT